MKILLLSASLNSGGVETGTIDLSKSLKKLGEDVIVVSSGGRLVKELENSEIKHIQLPVHKKSLSLFFQVPKLIKVIKDEHIDIVHAQSRMPAWIAYFACKRTHTPFVTSCHGYYSNHFFSRVMGWGREVIVISQIISRHMQEKFGVVKERIRLVYRGVDLSRYHYQIDKFRGPREKFRIVNISRITPIKGQSEFIRAIDIVAKQKPNIEVWIVGSADKKKKNYESQLHQLVKELNLEDRVKFLGMRSDIPKILMDSDMLVLSTRFPEAFGRVIIEAGAVGVPVCAPNIGGIGEIIEDRKDGLLFSCADQNSMAKAIITMLSNSDLMQQCRENLRKKVEDKFSLGSMTKKTLECYRSVQERKNILVIKLGGLGDLILATASLKMLRRKFPKAKISLLIYDNFQSLFRDCPYTDETILFNRKKTNLSELLNGLKQKHFDLSLDFKNNSLTHLVAYLARIPSRYGFSRGITGCLLNCAEVLAKDLSEEPVKQQYRILKKLGISSFDDTLQLWPNHQDEDSIDGILKKRGVLRSDKLIGLAIGASPEWPTKNWPIDNFSKLSLLLIQQGLKVILLGTNYLRKKVEKFPRHKNIISFVGETNLNQLVSLIKRLDVLITPDSAPMHIASATGTKIVALFGPTDPKRHVPPAKELEVLVSHLDCQPCYKRQCKSREKLACLNKIEVEEVLKTVIKILNKL